MSMNQLQMQIAQQINSREDFCNLIRCGMFFEIYPDQSGEYEDFCEMKDYFNSIGCLAGKSISQDE